jgi:RNA polymerase sigma factor (TIGR02999 family)
MGEAAAEVTQLLAGWRNGDTAALDRLIPLVYSELRVIAKSYLARERAGHSLQPTALVHEAYLRLVLQSTPDFQNRAHFFGVAAHLMRQILVDHARRKRAARRDAGRNVPLVEGLAISKDRFTDLIDLDDALTELADLDARKTKLVEMRYFAGLNVAEIGEAMALSEPTVYRDLKLAEVWLHRKLSQRAKA